ncbi:hypothetical protein [Aeribacillus sp. FSL M8-0254]|uniref:hypothetical protein n=1 Tax=Aeribacillus sp. FSL M8-0254 TaxID=2954577 RepID=UPI0030F8F56C
MNFEQFNERINELWAQTKAGKLTRAERFAAIERLTDEYIAATGCRPDPAQLDRLATLCLYEEVSDSTPWKTRNTEYPVHSDRQREEIERHEVGMAPLEYVASDGRKHEKPTRRKRSKAENAYMDRKYKSKKGER